MYCGCNMNWAADPQVALCTSRNHCLSSLYVTKVTTLWLTPVFAELFFFSLSTARETIQWLKQTVWFCSDNIIGASQYAVFQTLLAQACHYDGVNPSSIL